MSKYTITSSFPYQIDPLVLFSDIRIEHKAALGEYKALIDQKKYDEAITYLDTHKEVDAYCSDLFNMLVNRVKAVQKYASGDFTPSSGGSSVNVISAIPTSASSYSGQNVICVSSETI